MATSTEVNGIRSPVAIIGRRSKSLLDLLEPNRSKPVSPNSVRPSASNSDRALPSLWADDAHHRAVNFTQMFASLQNLAPILDLAINSDEVQRHAATLAGAYAELAADGSDNILLPCTPILNDIVVGLTTLFVEDAGSFTLRLSLDELWLTKDKRRALILIASELVINAVKYAFLSGSTGELSVALTRHGDAGKLTVQDDGVGMAEAKLPGTGTHLIDQLCGLIGGAIERSSPGRGLRIQVVFNPW